MNNIELTIGGVVVEPLKIRRKAYMEIDIENSMIKIEDRGVTLVQELSTDIKDMIGDMIGIELNGIKYKIEDKNKKGDKIQITLKEE